MKQFFVELEKDFEKIKKEIQIIEDKISKSDEESEELKKELSLAYFKLALCEALINRENKSTL